MINKTKVKHETIKQHVASIGCMCCAETMTMPQPDVQSIGVQCNLLAVPPLKKFQSKDNFVEETFTSEAEETDLDTSFHIFNEDTTTE